MGKYEPLSEFLRQQQDDEIRMSFEQIERIIGEKLPPKAQHHRAWWSNSPSNNVMTKAWLSAGFRSEQVDMERRKLVFRRVMRTRARHDASLPARNQTVASKQHPLIGWLKGTVRVGPGVDLTEPADPEWGQTAWSDRS